MNTPQPTSDPSLPATLDLSSRIATRLGQIDGVVAVVLGGSWALGTAGPGSDIDLDGKVLKALPTRDAVLPILSVLFSMAARRASMPALFEQLPKRFSRAALLKNFPRPT